MSVGIKTRLRTANRLFRAGTLLLVCVVLGTFDTSVVAYNFTFFGGRLGRPGVDTGPAGTNDFLYSWNKPDHGTITWFLDRNALTVTACDNACFTALKARVQPQLDKWALWIRVGFSEAANLNDADIRIRFIDFSLVAGSADAQPDPTDGVTGTTLNHVLIRIDPDGLFAWNTAAGRDDFAYTVLHETGHALGLGDLYLVDHGDSTFEGEDFCDHGLPSGPIPDTRTKTDNVMQTRGWTTLDNDSIHGAEWLWGCSGSNAIVTGKLAKRTGLNNANKVAPHHGLTQTPKTWTYRGSVAAFVSTPKVTLNFAGIQAARSVGPGTWISTIFPDRVEFDHIGPYEGNFKFELDCDQSSERHGDATVAGAVATNFAASPAGGGPQLFPFAMVFGADCGPPTQGACCCPDMSCFDDVAPDGCKEADCISRNGQLCAASPCPCDDLPYPCDWCWVETSRENNCPLEWCGDGECDCGCQFSDVDCGGTCPGACCCPDVSCFDGVAPDACIQAGCLPSEGLCGVCPCPCCDIQLSCDWCWLGTTRENNCPLDWCGDGECDCGCQFVDVDCSSAAECCSTSDCDDGNVCTTNSCVNGQCLYTANSAPCNDGQFCNGADTCSNRSCSLHAGTPCPGPDGDGNCSESCNEGSGNCTAPDPNDSSCNDNNACTTNDRCLNGACSGAVINCNDGQFCNGVETCNPGVGCVEGTPPDCDDGVDCTVDGCDEENDTCVHFPDDSLCGSGSFCEGGLHCDAVLGCVTGPVPDCDDGIACTEDRCDTDLDECVHEPLEDGCPDDNPCDGIEWCDPDQGCVPGDSWMNAEPECRTNVCAVRRNMITLTFDGPLPPNPEDACDLCAMPLNTDHTCPSPLDDNFDWIVDGNSLTLMQKENQGLENKKWYALSCPEGIDSVGPMEYQFVVCMGDANNDKFVNFADLVHISQGIPARSPLSPENKRRDCNGDGFVNFADLVCANGYNPSSCPMTPPPSP